MADQLLCEVCGKTYKTQRGLDGHVERQHPAEVDGAVSAATEKAIDAATHLTDMHAGPVAVLRRLARQIDAQDTQRPDGTYPPNDNTLMPTYLRYAAELGLTPVSAAKAGAKKEGRGGKLGELRALPGGKSA